VDFCVTPGAAAAGVFEIETRRDAEREWRFPLMLKRAETLIVWTPLVSEWVLNVREKMRLRVVEDPTCEPSIL
jgi:hypothetical protein